MNARVWFRLSRRVGGLTALAFCAIAGTGYFIGDQLQNRAVGATQPSYVGSKSCKICHGPAYSAWKDSHHGWALREPTAKNILGNFDNEEFTHKGVTSRFFKNDGGFFVSTPGATGETEDFEIKYSIGVAPLQQYLVELDRGRLQVLDTAWNTERKRWFHLYPDQELKPGDGLHWTGPYKNWQARCAECHQTNFVKGYDPKTRTYKSKWSELTVGCEACHGPSEAHVAWSTDRSAYDGQAFAGVDANGFTIAFDDKAANKELQLCARCHSRREPLGADSPPPSSEFADHYNLALLRPGLYHADGQIDDEVYVYGSFLQSRMFEKSVRCSDCHEPHSAGLKADGNGVCTQCHSVAGNPEFPSLKKTNYDTPAHHYHPADTAGAQCVSCHMPAKTYMVVDPRRDHSFRVPRPDLSASLKTPDACTSCHDDRSAVWASERVSEWYPQGRAGTPQHAEIFSKQRTQGITLAIRDELVTVALDTSKPAIVRATALDSLQGAVDQTMLSQLIGLLGDESDLIRAATARLLRPAPAQVRFQQLRPLVEDEFRSVRIAAARELVNIPPARFPEADRTKITAAIREYQSSLFAKADYPEIQMSLAGLALATRNLRAAEDALLEALRMDSQLGNAWHLLARVQQADSKPKIARETLEKAIVVLPDAAPLHHLLGNVLVQLGEMDRALETFKKASQLAPDNVAMRVDLATVLTRLKKHAAATPVIDEAYKLSPQDPNVLALLATNRLKRGRLKEARSIVRQLATRHPRYQLSPELRTLLTMPR